MSDAAHIRAAQRAIAYLESTISERSAMQNAALLGVLGDVPEAQRLTKKLVAQLRTCLTEAWLTAAGLQELLSVVNALQAHEARLVQGNHMGHVVQRMIGAEVAPGGPYMDEQKRVEPFTNAQAAGFLQWAAAPLPNVTDFLLQVIAERLVAGKRNLRTYDLLLQTKGLWDVPMVTAFTLATQRSGIWDSPATTVRAVALLQYNCLAIDRQPVIKLLLTSQLPIGAWSKKATDSHDADGFTTALAIRALLRSSEDGIAVMPLRSEHQHRHEHIVERVTLAFKTLPAPLRKPALGMANHICRADQEREITQLPAFFASSLKKRPARITEELIRLLGTANVYVWIAYTIYDDILDNEGDAHLLPVANVALRRALDCYQRAASGKTGFAAYMAEVFDATDTANAWEVTHCRFEISQVEDRISIGELPDYGNRMVLARRSYPHALGPMAIMAVYGFDPKSNTWRIMQTAFRHFIIARQLNDDLHDWQSDLLSGQINYVVAVLLRTLRVHVGVYALSSFMPTLKQHFWQHVLPEICQTILKHITLSRQAFVRSGLLKPDNDIEHLLATMECSAKEALVKREDGQRFLQTFKDD